MKANIGRLFGLVAFSLLGIGGVSAAEKALDSYEGARIMWLDTPYPFADTSPNYVGDAEAYMVGMEFTLPRASGEIARVIVLASSGGDASVYFNSRNAQGVGGFIGVLHTRTSPAMPFRW